MQRKWKKAVAALTVAALGMTTFAGCGGSTASDGSQAADTSAADGQVTIKFVHKFPEDKRMQYFNDIVAEFEEKNPNIKVEMTSYGDEEIKDKTRVLLGSVWTPEMPWISASIWKMTVHGKTALTRQCWRPAIRMVLTGQSHGIILQKRLFTISRYLRMQGSQRHRRHGMNFWMSAKRLKPVV